jgi:hypothetical protein
MDAADRGQGSFHIFGKNHETAENSRFIPVFI